MPRVAVTSDRRPHLTYPTNEHVLREEPVVERLERLAIVDQMNAFEVLKLGKIKHIVARGAPALLQLGHALFVTGRRIALGEPLFPRSFLVFVVIRAAVPQKLRRAERRLVDQVPDDVVNIAAAFGESRDELLLRFHGTRIEISIRTAPRLRQKREEREDHW